MTEEHRDRLRNAEGDRLLAARHARFFHAQSRACFIEHWHWIAGKMSPNERIPANDNQRRKP